jgi:hypothetical protein
LGKEPIVTQLEKVLYINKWAFWQIVIRQQPQRRRYEQTVNEIRQTTVGADISNRHAGFARFTTIYRDSPDFTRRGARLNISGSCRNKTGA